MLDELVELSAAGNQLEALPRAVGRLGGLQRLGLAGNRLRALPDELCSLRHLEGLWVHGNQLQGVPEDLGEPLQHDGGLHVVLCHHSINGASGA